MAFLWRGQHCLALDSAWLNQLPEQTRQVFSSGTNPECLDELARLALRPEWTFKIFNRFSPLQIDICNRWLHDENATSLHDLWAFCALSRVLSIRPFLASCITQISCRRQRGAFQFIGAKEYPQYLTQQDTNLLGQVLLGIYRCLSFDQKAFSSLFNGPQIQALLKHEHHFVRFLAVKILALQLHTADFAFHELLKTHGVTGPAIGCWDDREIDYRLLDLWEQRKHGLFQEFSGERTLQPSGILLDSRHLRDEDLLNCTVMVGGVLQPCFDSPPRSFQALVNAPSTDENLSKLGHALLLQQPILLTGLAGSGKSSLVLEAAKAYTMDEALLRLHLNEQTDAKLLIGMYTSAGAPGSFKWQPGVLTTAVREGRWALIEDLDRAPSEVISTILPLIERRQLYVPNLGGFITAEPSFKLFATIRSSSRKDSDELTPGLNMLGMRHWHRIHLTALSEEDLKSIMVVKEPILSAISGALFDIYRYLLSTKFDFSLNTSDQLGNLRVIGPHDLFKCSSRISKLMTIAGMKTGSEPISEMLREAIFLEILDCFAGFSTSTTYKKHVADITSQILQLTPQRREYCTQSRVPDIAKGSESLQVGRISLRRRVSRYNAEANEQSQSPFAFTHDILRRMEAISATVRAREPCLLVGETGTGKTTAVQQLAKMVGQKLIVVNLSQQSEAGDLLGGYKPLSLRSFALPMQDEFEELFTESMNMSKSSSQEFMKSVAKAFEKSRWPRLLAHWLEALKSIGPSFGVGQDPSTGNPAKRRKLGTEKSRRLHSRWERFSEKLEIFKMHLESGGRGFAFHFIEGNIVKAVREGSWVLLDEINLASPDTLESLADLLTSDPKELPSLILAETGEVEKVQAHSDFRIFAAMNPATDIGKRDLPQSLRSRFTEFYVSSPDTDRNSLIQIVESCLSGHIRSDSTITGNVSDLYMEIVKMERDNKLVDGANQRPHFSLRTLTRTLAYVLEIAPLYGLRRSIYEGFCMSFLTLLDNSSSNLVLGLIEKHVLARLPSRKAVMRQMPKKPEDGRDYVPFAHYWIRKGSLQARQDQKYIITPFIQANLLNLVRAASTRKFPVLLQGPTSSGKTSMVEYLAKVSGNRFVRINNHEHTDLQEYLGTYVTDVEGRLRFQEGILVEALRKGYWVVLDELNLAPTDVLEALNRLLDDNRELFIPETQEVVRPHEGFMLFATQNPAGLYGGRKALSRAFRNRFMELHFDDIPEDELQDILEQRTQIAPSFCKNITDVYKKLTVLRQSNRLFEQKNSYATLRDLFRWALRDADDRQQLAIHGYMLLAERVRADGEKADVQRIIEQVTKTKIDTERLYLSPAAQPSRSIGLAKSIVWTGSMRRMFLLVTEALQRNEPVLLIGGTGCGKTTVCQVIAELAGTQLHVVNAHQNTETGDLIGAQRPVRNRAAIELNLLQDLQTLSNRLGVEQTDDLDAILRWYASLSKEALTNISEDLLEQINEGIRRKNALFEWSDGGLIQAMKSGEHFLLDEISLADDSVLERLNSVLEPGRTMLLAEKGTNDSLVTAAPGFQFLATMNPGGDFGKRELSPALRNRFTEIWVPPITSEHEIEEIAEAALSADRKIFAGKMVKFAHWFSQTFHPASPHISIREILGWVNFLNITSDLADEVALTEGAALVYIDGIGANPAAGLQLSAESTSQARTSCLSKLDDLFQRDMSGIYHQKHEICISEDNLKVGWFSMSRNPGMGLQSQFSLQAMTTRKNMARIIRAQQLPRPILLEGNPGVGKTTLVSALSEAIGVSLTRINLSEQTDLMDLFGSDIPVEGEGAGHFAWRDAPFLQAMQRGEWVLLDEMNLASQSVLEGLNACLDHRGEVYVPELDQTFKRHPDFVLFAAQNPHSQGGGRKGLPASFVNRFTVVYTDTFSFEDLAQICKDRFSDVKSSVIDSIIQYVRDLSDLVNNSPPLSMAGGPWEFNLRDILRWLQIIATPSSASSQIHFQYFEQMLFLQRFRSLDSATLIHSSVQFDRVADPKPASISRNLSSRVYQVGVGVLERNLVSKYTKSTPMPLSFEILESIMISLYYSWPVLLTGSSGSGKTATIRHLAAIVGADLVELPLSSDMDTMDIIGGYEQVDFQRHFQLLIQRVWKRVELTLVQTYLQEDAIAAWNILETSDMQFSRLPELENFLKIVAATSNDQTWPLLLEECRVLQMKAAQDARALFEWTDGILVQALEEGKWLVLDHANLCSSSVLDRLNSLLEPNGVLVINEHHGNDGSARVIRPHPNFRLFLTMDPSYGELSRAMRNRCIEIYVPGLGSPLTSFSEPDLTDSSLFRLQIFVNAEWDNLEDDLLNPLLSISFDSLSFSDTAFLDTMSTQFAKGFMSSSKVVQEKARNALEWQMASQNTADTVQRELVLYYSDSASLYSAQADELVPFESIFPLHNTLFLNLNRYVSLGHKPYVLARIYDIRNKVNQLIFQLEKRQSVLISGAQKPAHCFDRSVLANTNIAYSKESTKPVSSFLLQTSSELLHWLQKQSSHRHDEESLQLAFEIVAFLWSAWEMTTSSSFDEAFFQALLLIGHRLGTRAYEIPAISELSKLFTIQLSQFTEFWQMQSGNSMIVMWQMLKPQVAIDQALRDLLFKVLRAADQLDKYMWNSQANLASRKGIQSSLKQTFRLMVNVAAAPENLKHVAERALENIRYLNTEDNSVDLPYFRSTFQGLLQLNDLSQEKEPFQNLDAIGVASCRPTRWELHGNDEIALQVLRTIQSSVGIGTDQVPIQAVSQSLMPNLLLKIQRMDEISLKSLPLLYNELDVLSPALGRIALLPNILPVHLLNARLLQFHCQLYQAHRSYLDADLSTEVESRIVEVLRLYPASDSEQESIPRYQDVPVPNLEQVRQVFRTQVVTSLGALEQAIKFPERAFIHSSLAWISAFGGFLLLFIPDKIFDPALHSVLTHQFHMERKNDTKSRLNASRVFDRLNGASGETSLTAKLRAELLNLEMDPTITAVYRGDHNDLHMLQSEFNAILSSIVSKLRDNTSETLRPEIINLLTRNTDRAIARLEQHSIYEDLVLPLIHLLRGLQVGLSFAELSQTLHGGEMSDISSITSFPIVFGFDRKSFLDSRNWNSKKEISEKLDSDLHYLKIASVDVLVTGSVQPSLFHSIHQIFNSFYLSWKDQLVKDQQDYTTKSSLYRYQAPSEDEATTNAEMKEIFPSYEPEGSERTYPETESSTHTRNLQTFAIKLSDLQSAIFAPPSPALESAFSKLFEESVGHLSGNLEILDPKTVHSIPAQQLLPASLHLLFKKGQTLNVGSNVSHQNFYTGDNIFEAKKILYLAFRVRERFVIIHAAWPEQASPVDVLKTVDELTSFPSTTPIAKLLTKSEQLYSFMSQWEQLASRQYSAAAMLKELSELLVSWRRLELSTWAKLLDMEDRRCIEAAKEWWFIAYETIIAASLTAHANEQDFARHISQLIRTLGEFLWTTSVGQFSHRLKMINNFRLHLRRLSQELVKLRSLENALETFLSYYQRFESAVNAFMKQKRDQLEKSMKEIIVLSSWKDTNIEALRAGAKSSHSKLFKVVRKYRSLLAEPAGPLLSKDIETNDDRVELKSSHCKFDVSLLEIPVKEYQNAFENWAQRPDRFRNPTKTLQIMDHIAQTPQKWKDCIKALESWRLDIQKSSTKLRKETPSTTTEENRGLVQNLRSRKRRLFADVLKDIRVMGLRTNIDLEIKAGQDSIFSIICASPETQDLFESSSVSDNFYVFIDNMLKAQARTKDRSQDLANQEVERCLTYLHGFAHILVKQRQCLKRNFLKLQQLVTLLRSFNSISNTETITPWNGGESRDDQISRAKWIPVIINFVLSLLEIQHQAGTPNYDEIQPRISQQAVIFTELGQQLESVQTVSGAVPVQNNFELQVKAKFDKAAADLRNEINSWQRSHPAYHFTFEHLRPWLQANMANGETHQFTSDTDGLDKLDSTTQKCIDNLLVLLQNVGDCASSFETVAEDKDWIVRNNKLVHEMLDKFSIDKVLSLGQRQLSRITQIKPGPQMKVAISIYGYTEAFFTQYAECFERTVQQLASFHESLTITARELSDIFCNLLSQGFCNPNDSSEGEAQTHDKLEDGTGLGEGEGAQDISKDIQDDEDLSELAQSGKPEDENESVENEENAVDMADQELEGKFDDEVETKEGEEEDSGTEDVSPEEKVDEIDNEDPGALDEKLWDDENADDANNDSKKSDTSRGQKNDDVAANENSGSKEADNKALEDAEDETQEESGEADMTEGIPEINDDNLPSLDSKLEGEEKLDLPDDMELDGDQKSVAGSDSDEEMDQFNEVSEETAGGTEEENEAGENDNQMQDEATIEEENPKNDETVTKEDSSESDNEISKNQDDAGLQGDPESNFEDEQLHTEAGLSGSAAQETNMQNDQGDIHEANEEFGATKSAQVNQSEYNEVDEAQDAGPEGNASGKGDFDDSRDAQAFKKLGDALENFQRSLKEISEPSRTESNHQETNEEGLKTQDFEHLPHENAKADTQALGAADDEQAKGLDKGVMDLDLPEHNKETPENLPMLETEEDTVESTVTQEDGRGKDSNKTDTASGALIGPSQEVNDDKNEEVSLPPATEEQIQELDDEFSDVHLTSSHNDPDLRPAKDAQQLWIECESTTHELSLALTEQLRLILAPTLATKMRGDFRTGKRLNIKRIIPYIASQYKRDKIWMRRSIPSKRNYQIMLAIDDSKSMDEPESGSARLAFETLALVSRSLNMLEAGELCIVGFGEDVRVVHQFDQAFSSATGPRILQRLNFQQTKTDVRKLMFESLKLFKEARAQIQNTNTALWQLQLIISDGICEDHETIQRLVREAHQERIMVIFVIVDALKGQSITSLQQASFETNPKTGQPEVRMRRYLEDFPFSYYLIVGNVKDLPGVLATALRQWFSEVSDT